MTSIYERALGHEFELLHPKMQQRFAVDSTSSVAQIGRGTMEEIWRGPAFTLPFLMLGASRNILFPLLRKRERDVAFTVCNYAYVDGLGRETVTWSRRFRFAHRVRGFDATMIYSEKRGRIIDYIGTHQHLAVDIHLSVDTGGALCLNAGEQRFYERRVGFKFPALFTGQANVREWWDDVDNKYRIEVVVRNKLIGEVFGYRGSFTVQAASNAVDDMPLDVRPFREELRD